MLKMCENRRPGTFKNNVFHWRLCKYHYVHLSPKGSQNVTNIYLKIEPKSIKHCFRSIMETSRKNIPKLCQTIEEMGVQREPKSELKSLEKGIQNMFFFLWVPLGAQGAQGSLLNGFWLHFWRILERFLVDVGSYRLYILGIFSTMRYRSLRRFPVPLVTTVYIYI